MDILTTSLEALLQRATNPQNENVDKAAVEAFCALVNKETEGSHIAIRLLANKIHAQNEKEALQTLGILDACMKKCGSSFQSEVGKFRFLNEMIKLVSPKYLGSQTPPLVRVKVLQLLQVWTDDYPKETKIKEAYDMLKKQGVVVEVASTQKTTETFTPRPTKTNSIFDNDERSRLLQKLLQSKNPDDLQAANRLIKTMVKEDDKRAEMVSKRVIELEAVHNNIRLLNEMLDSFRPGVSSFDEVELIKELYQSCERLRPNVYRLATETQQNEEMLKEVLQASDDLSQVFNKYTAVIVRGLTPSSSTEPSSIRADGESLLDLGSPSESQTPSLLDNATVINNNQNKVIEKPQSNMDALCDIFSSPVLTVNPVLTETDILKPTTIASQKSQPTTSDEEKFNSKIRALEDLDALGESLLKENLSVATTRIGTAFNRTQEKIPMNLLPKQQPLETPTNTTKSSAPLSDLASGLDLNYLIDGKSDVKKKLPPEISANGDDCMVDISEDIDTKICLQSDGDKEIMNNSKDVQKTVVGNENKDVSKSEIEKRVEIKPMTDLSVTLESVKPSSIPPLTVLEEKNGISVLFHFAKDRPREDVQVIVVTTLSKNTSPLSNYHFQAVVPKTCKIKLQPPSGSDLPAHNPFLPPSAITQIMLLANPNNEKVSLKFMISYTMDDEMCTEMGEVDGVPNVA